MTTLGDVKNLTAWDVTAGLGAFLAVVAPGILAIMIYEVHLIYELESAKLVMLSASFTLPVIVVNAFLVACIGPFTRSIGAGPGVRKHLFFWQATWALFTFYSALGVAYFFEIELDAFMGAVAAFDILYGIVVLWIMRSLISTDP